MILRMEGYPDTQVSGYEEGSRVYGERRDDSDLGASGFGDGWLHEGSARVARISYNGRIWDPGPYRPDAVPLYDNRH
jgi:hypothetical protein